MLQVLKEAPEISRCISGRRLSSHQRGDHKQRRIDGAPYSSG